MESIPADNRSGDFCPNCKSTDVREFFYGYYLPEINDSIDVAVEKRRFIPGGCSLTSECPKYKCSRCSYKWGNHVDLFNRIKATEEKRRKNEQEDY